MMVHENIPALVVTPKIPTSIEGNFKDIENYLRKREKEVSTLELTEKNIVLVKSIKSEAVNYRRRAEEILKEVRQRLFKDPDALLKAKVQPIFDLIASIETRTDEVLDKKEAERIADFTKVLDIYKNQFQEKYHLSEKYLSRVMYKKQYYNKTAVEKESKVDLETQFLLLHKEEKVYEASVRLITMTCKDDPRLNTALYIKMLDDEDSSTIMEKIEAEKKRLAAVDVPAQEAPAPVATETVTTGTTVLGITDGLDFSTDFPGRMKTVRVEISYPCDTGDALTDVFKRLKEQYGIKIKLLKEEEVVF